MGCLMESVNADTSTYGWYNPLRLAEIFTESASTSFDFVGDHMP